MTSYIAVDLEMTGLRLKSDHILEIGAVHMEAGKPIAEFSAMINPHCAIPEQITKLTGITQEMANAGDELSDILPRFLDFAGVLPLLGHNLMFDYSFLKQAMVNAKLTFERTGIDTLRLARKFLPGEQKKSLEALRHYFSIETDSIHRALSDAFAAALVFEHLWRDFGQTEPDIFLPKPLQANIKKQQPITIPQREQLTRLLSAHPSVLPDPVDPDRLTRSEASRLIERLLHLKP